MGKKITRTDPPSKPEYELEWVSLWLVAQMATGIESEGVRV